MSIIESKGADKRGLIILQHFDVFDMPGEKRKVFSLSFIVDLMTILSIFLLDLKWRED